MNGMRIDRFTFKKGDLQRVTDKAQLNAAYRQSGFQPLSQDEKDWIAQEWSQRWEVEEGLSTDQLRDEYAKNHRR
jgi:hypothetical protein